jgi:hypothetical protein
MQDFQLINSYKRAHAIDDEVLIDVTSMAREAGFRYPVFITRNLWDGYIDPAPQLQHENTTSRLWDTLANLAATIKSTKNPGNCLWFTVSFQMCFDGKRSTEEIRLQSIVKRGYNSTKVITIMLPDES